MERKNYKIIFTGEIVPGYDTGKVKKNLADLFKVNIEQIKPLFTGKPVVIKENLEQEKAKRYEDILNRAGALCRIESAPESAAINPSAEPAWQGLTIPGEITFKCDHCGFSKSIPGKYSDKVIKCPQCKSDVRILAEVMEIIEETDKEKEMIETLKREFNSTVVWERLDQDQGMKIEPTGKGKRFVNFILDILFGYIFAFVFAFLLGLLGLSALIDEMNLIFLILLIMTSYYVLFESLWGKSIAKFITRTKVVTESGDKPTFMSIIKRTLCRFNPYDPFSFLGENPDGWHDRISNTRVIKDEEFL